MRIFRKLSNFQKKFVENFHMNLDDINEPLNNIQNVETPDDIPEETKWKQVKNCCGAPVLLVMPVDRLFIKHWELSLCIPIFVASIIIFCIVSYFISVFPYLTPKYLQLISPIEIFFMFILFLWSYLYAAFSDPGFLPFDWVKSKKTYYTWEEQLNGLAIRTDQFEFARKHHPNFASFSSMSGRFIIRADHFCGWITNWVGKRNHKQFILLTFYGFLFCLSLVFWRFFTNVNFRKTNKSLFVVNLISLIFEASYAVALFIFFIENLINLFKNRTQIMKWKNKNANSSNCCDGVKDVCGEHNICCYFLPTPAFGKEIDNLV